MRLLDADKLKPKIKYIAKSYGMGAFTKEKLLDAIDKCAIEAEPVQHGHWVKIKGRYHSSTDGRHGNVQQCSVCGELSPCGYGTLYCAICGAKMDLEENKND